MGLGIFVLFVGYRLRARYCDNKSKHSQICNIQWEGYKTVCYRNDQGKSDDSKCVRVCWGLFEAVLVQNQQMLKRLS